MIFSVLYDYFQSVKVEINMDHVNMKKQIVNSNMSNTLYQIDYIISINIS